MLTFLLSWPTSIDFLASMFINYHVNCVVIFINQYLPIQASEILLDLKNLFLNQYNLKIDLNILRCYTENH